MGEEGWGGTNKWKVGESVEDPCCCHGEVANKSGLSLW